MRFVRFRMLRTKRDISRRGVLRSTGGTIGALLATGIASEKPDDVVEVNVGYHNARGRRAAYTAVSNVVRTFAVVPASNFDDLEVDTILRTFSVSS